MGTSATVIFFSVVADFRSICVSILLRLELILIFQQSYKRVCRIRGITVAIYSETFM